MQGLLDFLGRGFHEGRIDFIAPGGEVFSIGSGTPRVGVCLHHRNVLRYILLSPGLHLGETYVDDLWHPERGQLVDILDVGVRLADFWQRRFRGLSLLARIGGWIGELNGAHSSRSRIEHHYDLDEALYRSFLDADLHYSCAYFGEGVRSLEQAQQAKCELIARKLDLRPGMRVLDIGCGWGSLAMYLARHRNVHVTGITLSALQAQSARRRAAERGLAQQIDIRLQDYRAVEGEFDAVVSVGMFEHVGRPQYRTFFDTVRRRLRPGGTALIHAIGRSSPPGSTNAWIRKYIFPGGYIPAASEMLGAVEPESLIATDLEVWRLHYARTLAEWHRRFQSVRRDVRARLGERFCRLWEFYLQSSEASFRSGELVVFQLQLARQRERLPLTRDYLYRSPGIPSAEQKAARYALVSVGGVRQSADG